MSKAKDEMLTKVADLVDQLFAAQKEIVDADMSPPEKVEAFVAVTKAQDEARSYHSQTVAMLAAQDKLTAAQRAKVEADIAADKANDDPIDHRYDYDGQ